MLLAVLTQAQEALSVRESPLTPEQGGVNSKKLYNIGEMLQQAVEENQIPEVVALIAKDGKIVFHEVFGTANEERALLKEDVIFPIASKTKAITSTAVMMLWEEGKFRLDDPILQYLPEFNQIPEDL